jgi:cation diffusion facilitator family transporter
LSVAAERREKNRVTLVSVAAGLALTALKLIVGLLTGSLGMISEAAHSGLDFVASLLTYVAVRVAGRPADADHPYGHGRVENLSATIQGVLLLGTAAAIIYESVRRIFFVEASVEVSVWAFVVMLGSIVVDLWRSRMLSAAARRYHSQALEADALNFRADMFSSAVVILGLAIAAVGGRFGHAGLLAKADAVAALVVALVIVVMSGRLASRAVGVLLDRAPTRLRERMTEAAAAVPGVLDSEPVRLRESGDRLFADITVHVPRTTSLSEAHAITERVEVSIRGVEPRTQTVVHVEPLRDEEETAAEGIRAVAWQMGARTHHEVVHRVGDHLEASLHIEVEPELTLKQAHALAHRLVAALQGENALLRRVDTHIEVAVPDPSQRQEIGARRPEVVATVKRAVAEAGGVFHEVRVYGAGPGQPGLDITLHCGFDPDVPMGEIHRRTEQIELEIRRRLPSVEHVVIHAEPRE